jgi:hypothetical protein
MISGTLSNESESRGFECPFCHTVVTSTPTHRRNEQAADALPNVGERGGPVD